MFYLPDEHEDITALIAKGKARQKAERAILSTTCAALGVAVAKKWDFPETITNCMTHLPPGVLEPAISDEEILCHAANFANELCELIMSTVEDVDLLIEVDTFIDCHQAIFTGDATRLAQLASATAEKFFDLAPGLGINYNDSSFCKRLSNFASAIEAVQSEETLVEGAVAV